MKVDETGFDGLIIITPDVYNDERGYFFESFNKEKFELLGLHADFVQDNQSMSHKNVLRGLHFQNPPYEQGKLVRVIQGALIDVVVDIRRNSQTFMKHFAVELNATENKMMWIPPGFAHGFVSLTDNTVLNYKCTNVYNRQSESGIYYADAELNINWNCDSPLVSDKDKNLPDFKNCRYSF